MQIRIGDNAILFFVHLPERITYRKWIDRTRQVRDEMRAAGGSTAAEELNQFADPEAEVMPEPSTPDLLGAVLQRGIEIVQGEYQERH